MNGSPLEVEFYFDLGIAKIKLQESGWHVKIVSHLVRKYSRKTANETEFNDE